MNNETFEAFNAGRLCLEDRTIPFTDIHWSAHPVFEGVELKHIVTARDTDGVFSYHLVRIAPNKRIGDHIHETQLETHEVIAGDGICINGGYSQEYAPGAIAILPAKVHHEVQAGSQGLYLFAKFFPALC